MVSRMFFLVALTLFNVPFFSIAQEQDPDLTVDDGQLTFDAEGAEGGPYHSRTPHVPTDSSGVTIGRGYDMKTKTKAKIEGDLVKVQMAGDEASKYSKASGLKGSAARLFIKDNKLKEISKEQQKALFAISFSEESAEVRRICEKQDVVDTYGKTDWDALNPVLKDVLVDLKFRGDYTPASRKLIQSFVARNDFESFKSVLQNKTNWPNVPDDRFERRSKYLDAKKSLIKVLSGYVSTVSIENFRNQGANGRRCRATIQNARGGKVEIVTKDVGMEAALLAAGSYVSLSESPSETIEVTYESSRGENSLLRIQLTNPAVLKSTISDKLFASPKPPKFNGNFSEDQKTKLTQAHNKTYELAVKANAALSNDPLYKTWFGTFSESRRNRIKKALEKVQEAMLANTYTYDSTNNNGIGQCDGNTYAWTAYTHEKIFVCPEFWKLPEDAATMAGTLLHEYLHILDPEIVDHTSLNVESCKSLANSAPEKAINNGASYQRYVENLP